jgi:uncharacterized protein DUF6916
MSGALEGLPLWRGAWKEPTTMTEPLTADTFLPYVDKVFRVKDGRHALTLSRVEVHRMEAREAALNRRAFTLIFAGPPGDVLREGLHTLEVENGPALQLYVIPFQTFARDRQDYQVVVN